MIVRISTRTRKNYGPVTLVIFNNAEVSSHKGGRSMDRMYSWYTMWLPRVKVLYMQETR